MYPNDVDPQGGGQPLFQWSSHYWKHSENACLSGNCLPADGTFFRIVLMMVNLSLLNLNFGPYVTGNFLAIPTQGNTQRIKQWHKPITTQLRPTSCFAGVRTYLTLSPGVGLWSGRSTGVTRGMWTLIGFLFCIVFFFTWMSLYCLPILLLNFAIAWLFQRHWSQFMQVASLQSGLLSFLSLLFFPTL